MPVTGLPANCGFWLSPVTAYSGPGKCCASGGVPGQIGICVWPKEGCQTELFACAIPHAVIRHMLMVHMTAIEKFGFKARPAGLVPLTAD
jgi:hypothetical protein